MNDSLWTFGFEIANFVALAAVLGWLFFKPVRKALEEQQAKARRLEEGAARTFAAAERLRADIESQRLALARELEAMRAKSRESAMKQAEQILAEARAHAQRERATLKREALYIERAQTAKIAAAVATTTHHTMKRFFEELEGPQLEQTLINAACRELQTFANNSLSPVTIESATPLDHDSSQLIKASLGRAAKTADFRVVPELKGGLRISTAQGLIDASIAGLAQFAEQSFSAEIEALIREESESD